MRRSLASLLALLLALQASLPPLALLTAEEAWARSRSSGGYSRPSSSRTPSFSTSRPVVRTPSTSGGYARPSPSVVVPRAVPLSPGDQQMSRQRSSEALGAYRAQQEQARRPAAPSYRPPLRTAPPVRPVERPGWYAQRGWASPPPYYAPRRSFGVWDGLFLGMLLSNLTRPGSLDFFHNHRDDQGYQQWRADVDRQARDNPELKSRLDTLDQQLATRADQPRDPAYLPPDITPEIALADDARTPSFGGDHGGVPWVLIAVLAGGAVVGWVIWSRRRSHGPSGGSSMNPLGSAVNILRRKLSGETYTPDKFRVGMVMAFDPTPFILAAGAIKVPAPAPDAGSARISVEAVGQVSTSQGAELTRLYLPAQRGMFQLHLDRAGNPDECRFFALIDEVTPANPNEWGAWLDPADGMIGWPQFQTKDGKLYDRVWAPSSTRTPPLRMRETIETTQGSHVVQSQAMLYAAPTGLAEPAPQTEYILLAAVEAQGRASIEIAAGIDVNPATLSLA